MPELAEVEYYRKVWEPGLGRVVEELHWNPEKRVFRGMDFGVSLACLRGRTFISSEARGKWMLFGFSGGWWMGIHLGMSGRLVKVSDGSARGNHDHLVLELGELGLVYRDPRLFGRVSLDHCREGSPLWWRKLPPALLEKGFTRLDLLEYLTRHAKAPIKACLLDQARFPGLGNWMVDEILWRIGIHPATNAGAIDEATVAKLYRCIRRVCRDALSVIGKDWSRPPDSWLFNHRWKDGGICPKTRTPLVRTRIAGRTTCFSPVRQQLFRGRPCIIPKTISHHFDQQAASH